MGWKDIFMAVEFDQGFGNYTFHVCSCTGTTYLVAGEFISSWNEKRSTEFSAFTICEYLLDS
jgi:hypothetical protein